MQKYNKTIEKDGTFEKRNRTFEIEKELLKKVTELLKRNRTFEKSFVKRNRIFENSCRERNKTLKKKNSLKRNQAPDKRIKRVSLPPNPVHVSD